MHQLQKGASQPFYHVLVDTRDWPLTSLLTAPVAYVPEELLTAPEVCLPCLHTHGPVCSTLFTCQQAVSYQAMEVSICRL